MKRALILGAAIVMMVMLVPTVSYAVGVSALTVITSEGTTNILNYQDANDNQRTQEHSDNVLTTVKPVYGLNPDLTPGYGNPPDQNTTPGVAVQYDYGLANVGNESDTYNLTKSYTLVGAQAANWTIVCTSGAGSDVSTLGPISEDGQWPFSVKVTPSTQDAEAADGTYAVVTVDANTGSSPVGAYIGANGSTYGGTSDATADMTVTTIVVGKMTISRTATTDAPNVYVTNGGDVHDAVPGGVVTYRITYNNIGSAKVKQVVIVDRVPDYIANTLALHVNRTATTNVTSINGGNKGTGPTWEVFYSTSISSNPVSYEVGGWTLLGTLDAAGAGEWSLPTSTRLVKWRKAEVPAGETKVLTWGVIIQ